MTYHRCMRWAPNARGRLEQAAFELFAEDGYAATTVPAIAARAGLTTRTFFRYFPDKREVIFGGDDIPDTAAQLIRGAPAELAPEDVIRAVLHQVAVDRFEGRKQQTSAWRQIIDENDSLRDRDARKRADLVRAARDAFVDRGEPLMRATLFAEAGALVFHVALDHWLSEGGPGSMTESITDIMNYLHVGTPRVSSPRS